MACLASKGAVRIGCCTCVPPPVLALQRWMYSTLSYITQPRSVPLGATTVGFLSAVQGGREESIGMCTVHVPHSTCVASGLVPVESGRNYRAHVPQTKPAVSTCSTVQYISPAGTSGDSLKRCSGFTQASVLGRNAYMRSINT